MRVIQPRLEPQPRGFERRQVRCGVAIGLFRLGVQERVEFSELGQRALCRGDRRRRLLVACGVGRRTRLEAAQRLAWIDEAAIEHQQHGVGAGRHSGAAEPAVGLGDDRHDADRRVVFPQADDQLDRVFFAQAWGREERPIGPAILAEPRQRLVGAVNRDDLDATLQVGQLCCRRGVDIRGSARQVQQPHPAAGQVLRMRRQRQREHQ